MDVKRIFLVLPLLKNLPSLILPRLDEIHHQAREAVQHHHGALGAGVEPFGENLEPFLGGLARLASDENRDVQGAVLSGHDHGLNARDFVPIKFKDTRKAGRGANKPDQRGFIGVHTRSWPIPFKSSKTMRDFTAKRLFSPRRHGEHGVFEFFLAGNSRF